VVGNLNFSPQASIAQDMRAFFAAMATTAFQQPRRSSSAIAQRLVHCEDVLGEIDADVDNSHGLPLPSELMRVRTFHRGTSLPVAAPRLVRDGEVPFIR
jgi:hypothetical protein